MDNESLSSSLPSSRSRMNHFLSWLLRSNGLSQHTLAVAPRAKIHYILTDLGIFYNEGSCPSVKCVHTHAMSCLANLQGQGKIYLHLHTLLRTVIVDGNKTGGMNSFTVTKFSI